MSASPNTTTRDRLIASGKNLFTTKGYHGVGLKEILAAAETPKGSFYHFFGSKEEFATEVAIAYATEMGEEFDRAYAATDRTPLDFLKVIHLRAIETYRAKSTQNGCLLARLSMESGRETPQMHARVKRLIAMWIGRLATLIKEAQEAEQARTDISATALATTFWHGWEGSLIHMKIEDDCTIPEQTLALLIQSLIATHPSQSTF